MGQTEITSTYLETIIKEKKIDLLRQIFDIYPSVDLAEIINEFDDITKIIFIFKTVKSEDTADLFSYLSANQKEKLIQAFSDKEIALLLDNSFTDDIADFIADLPANLVNRVLNASTKEMRTQINHLLNYKNGTAGAIMTTEYVSLHHELTAKEALAQIKEQGPSAETIYSTFVINNRRQLIGVLYLEDLIYADENVLISTLMNREFKAANVYERQETVAHIFKRYSLTVLPVTNDDGCLIGVITIDDILGVIEDEVSEDIEKMAGLRPLDQKYFDTSTPVMAKKRIVWLLILMISATFTSMIISSFESSLQKITILSAFIPMVMSTCGNAGGQTTSLITRGLATNEFTLKDYFRVLLKEIKVALITGLIVAVANFSWVFFELEVGLVEKSNAVQSWQIAILVSTTLLITIIFAKSIGASLPMFAKKIKIDPALMSGPLVTTLVDTISLLTYFLICTQVLQLV